MRIALLAVVVLALSGCASAPTSRLTPAAPATDLRVWDGWEPSLADATLTLSSTDFAAGEEFPRTIELNRYGCTGPNERPELHWSGVPDGTKSIVLTFTAEGGGPTDRWIAFDLPPETTSLPAAAGDAQPSVGALARASSGSTVMLGPCSKEGESWELWFTVYALDTELGLADGVNAIDVRLAGIDHVLAAAELNGFHTYLAK
jgi:Raf kinase inhibitor-like YbhB/YbcL family protein